MTGDHLTVDRCPAVPGLSLSARAIPMAFNSSVLPSGMSLLKRGTAYCTCGYCHCVNRGTAHGGP
ncbi:hypothetical protein EAO71_25010 [Streptomyces sp. ms191]|nr:hypothetical protein EAO71_25010 [Streptomyces sp. ms191]